MADGKVVAEGYVESSISRKNEITARIPRWKVFDIDGIVDKLQQ